MTTSYDKRFVALRFYMYGKGYHTALRAFHYARKYHTGKRLSGDPELQHQVDIALYLSTLKDIRAEEKVLAVAMLHDVVEDYAVIKEFTPLFDKEIVDCVWRLTKPGSKGRSYESLTAEARERYFNDIANDPIASLVKGADRINNVQTMPGAFSKEKQQQYVDEVEKYFLPMIKKAMANFSDQSPAYFNISHMLKSQVALIKLTL